MKTETESGRRDTGGMLAAAAFIVIALAALWDTTTMADPDSYVFPRTVAIAMIVFCTVYIVWQWLSPGPGDSQDIPGASPARRVGLVAALLGGVGAMPWIGFPAAGALVFLITMAVAMYDPWTPRRGIIYPLVGLAIVAAFYLLFSKILLVPLPSGSWFD